MDSTMAASPAAATTAPAGRKHKPTSSLGSLYEVLADLDENQLDYLLQEMNHTGHQNVKVSQAVSAFDSQSPPQSFNGMRTSMLPSAPGLERQSSKSQQGKLRLQTAFQRAPSLRNGQKTDSRASQHVTSKPADAAKESPKPRHQHKQQQQPFSFPAQSNSVERPSPEPSPEPQIHLPKRDSAADTTRPRRPTASSTRTISAYKRISRPEFSLPPGITVTDLLLLLEAEFLSPDSQDTAASPSSLSTPVSAFPARRKSSPFLSAAGSSPGGGRTLRRHSSRLDMALEAERNASGIEEIGLGLLEPRASPPTMSLGSSAPGTPTDIFGRGLGNNTPPQSSPLVMEGIFDVLENR